MNIFGISKGDSGYTRRKRRFRRDSIDLDE